MFDLWSYRNLENLGPDIHIYNHIPVFRKHQRLANTDAEVMFLCPTDRKKYRGLYHQGFLKLSNTSYA